MKNLLKKIVIAQLSSAVISTYTKAQFAVCSIGSRSAMHAAMNKGLTFKMGQTHMQHYMKPLLEKVINGEIDPSFIITHRGKLADAPELYATFDARRDGCVKVVMTP